MQTGCSATPNHLCMGRHGRAARRRRMGMPPAEAKCTLPTCYIAQHTLERHPVLSSKQGQGSLPQNAHETFGMFSPIPSCAVAASYSAALHGH